MKIKGLISEDFVNYKKPAMTIMYPHCTLKCGAEYCQNSSLVNEKEIDLEIEVIVNRYMSNPITESIVMQGLEPFDSWDDLIELVKQLRERCSDDIVIFTGYNKDELEKYIEQLKEYPNIIVKFGRFIPDQEKHYDEVLGIYLASDNQYAEKIS